MGDGGEAAVGAQDSDGRGDEASGRGEGELAGTIFEEEIVRWSGRIDGKGDESEDELTRLPQDPLGAALTFLGEAPDTEELAGFHLDRNTITRDRRPLRLDTAEGLGQSGSKAKVVRSFLKQLPVEGLGLIQSALQHVEPGDGRGGKGQGFVFGHGHLHGDQNAMV
jgi:hypothetical protein